jgi:hypothetical protein
LNFPADDDRHECIGKNDIGLLMLGGISSDGTILRDAFDLAFSAEKVRKEWKKAGINPFTREALQSSKMWHEISENLDCEDVDPKLLTSRNSKSSTTLAVLFLTPLDIMAAASMSFFPSMTSRLERWQLQNHTPENDKMQSLQPKRRVRCSRRPEAAQGMETFLFLLSNESFKSSSTS